MQVVSFLFQGATVGNTVVLLDTSLLKQDMRICDLNMAEVSVKQYWSHLRLQVRLFANCNVKVDNS
jgi:hypothetical protein